jgi:hypothetical protein
MVYVSVCILFIVISRCCCIFCCCNCCCCCRRRRHHHHHCRRRRHLLGSNWPHIHICGSQVWYVGIIQNRLQCFYSISLPGKAGLRLDCSNSSLIKLINTEDIFVTYFHDCHQCYICLVDYFVLVIKQGTLWDNRRYSARCGSWSTVYCNTVAL